MQLKKQSLIMALASSDIVTNKDGLVLYTVTSGKFKSEHQARIDPDEVEAYKERQVASANAAIEFEIEDLEAFAAKYPDAVDAEAVAAKIEELKQGLK